jgi:hypothetical protein
VNKGANEREYARLLAHWFEAGQTYFRFKIADLRALWGDACLLNRSCRSYMSYRTDKSEILNLKFLVA